MIVTFSWPKAQSPEKSASVISMQIWISGHGHLKFLDPPDEPKDEEVLTLEARGLSDTVYSVAVMGLYNIPIWQKIEDIIAIMREHGITPEVRINGDMTIWAYAAQEEARGAYFKKTLEYVRQALKATRNWIKDRRIADIRQEIDDCFKGEARVRLVSYRHTLVEEEPKDK
ncbi:MAG: hypothetical protein ACYC5G_00575 [Candidatus Doudnabacteria bacterium]